MKEHGFTPIILGILQADFGEEATQLFKCSELLQYLNIKTKSASSGSKSRGSFANHYALYVLIEDYISNGFHEADGYENYDGARYSDLFTRQRELPFGSKLQNHALNHRLNQEFKKYFSECEFIPIMRDAETKTYWINENLLRISIGESEYNIAESVIKIIDAYIHAKRDAFESFITTCNEMNGMKTDDPTKVRTFIEGLLKPNVDARVFEIVSFAILKEHYKNQSIYWGWTQEELTQEFLMLFKTGRCNANDGGIDFVMRPLGRFFQVTETTDVKKYFLDIDKVQRYPVTFVVKSLESSDDIVQRIKQQAKAVYGVAHVVQRYMECVEEVINIPILSERLKELADDDRIGPVIDEVLIQSKVEFNYEETPQEEE